MNVETIKIRPEEPVPVDPAEWERRAAATRRMLEDDGVPKERLFEALGDFVFVDPDGRDITYDGKAWLAWNGTQWVASARPASIVLRRLTVQIALDDAPAVRPPTHRVPAEGMSVYARPHPDAERLFRFDGATLVRILETKADWARVQSEEGRVGWVDDRRLRRLAEGNESVRG